MGNPSRVTVRFPGIISGILVLSGLYLTSLYSYLLFHSLVELFSIVIACGIFMLAWNSRAFLDNNYLLFLGIAYLFVGGLDLVHTLAYKGMNIFQGYGANLPTQLWISGRYMESVSLLIAPLFLGRRINIKVAFFAYAVAITLLLATIFYWNIFPDCFIEGVGLTGFKKVSEYVISLILMGAILLLFRRREEFDPAVFKLLVASIMLTIGAELAFTFYVSVYGLSNSIGHFLKIISFYLIYKAIIETGLVRPYNLLFRNLKQSEEGLKKNRHELEQKTLALEELNLRLQEATRLKSQFLANMSHELRTPLNSIIGFTGIILQGIVGELNEEQKKQLNMVYDSAKHLLGLINDILDLSKIEAGKIEIVPAEFEIRDLVETVRKMVAPMVEERGLAFETDISDGVPSIVYNDKNRIKQVLINLLSNAIKFTPSGEIRLIVSAERGVRNAEQSEIRDPKSKMWGPEIQFSVTDTGIGIKPEHLTDIFDEFRQIEGPLREKPVGTGLGLAISKKMVEMMGGSIRAESEYGKGSTFHFTIPAKERKPSERPAAVMPEALDPSKKLVLAIDDEFESQEILKTYLKTEGYEVIQAYSGMEAKVLAGKYRPFAITLDIIMPGRDGWQILEELKSDPTTEDIPVICISILDNRELGLSLGAVEHLTKPVEKDQLIRELNRLKKKRRIYDILIVDDDPKAVALLSQYFAGEDDYSIRKAYGGGEGLMKVKEKHPDLLILDLMMPGVDGFQVISDLKKHKATKQIPIIIVSGKELTLEDASCLNSKIEKLIRKERFGKEQLLDDIKNALEKIGQ